MSLRFPGKSFFDFPGSEAGVGSLEHHRTVLEMNLGRTERGAKWFPWGWSCPAAEGGPVHPALHHRSILFPYPTALQRDELMENTFCTCSWLFPGISLCWRGKVKPPDPPCGWEMPVELCGAALGTGSLGKNVAVFSEGAPPALPCEM